ncbi:hypothetical protein TOPH_09206 [Tolypocladium ophioglossoides CBS 100239]|uniref:Uncharacterized protein n=1 Tax=Tolypocladium ophioglossoides (strain CBS 100239) TaxID=1163406 RepID=A0A0L0MWK9_TOLOC|nr:hypothetical protein TOPH_09206 [Tolypocladium ophioglossoides CBS 100239]
MATKVQILGLNRGLTEADMEQSRQLYNSLPSDESQPDVVHLLQQLAEIFVRNNAYKVFGVYLLHGHFQIPEKNVLLYGHTFVLTDNGFHPYEYHSGKHPDIGQVGDNFIPELADSLSTNGLSRIIALEVLDSPLPEAMIELVLGDHGTMVMEPERLRGCRPFQQTG